MLSMAVPHQLPHEWSYQPFSKTLVEGDNLQKYGAHTFQATEKEWRGLKGIFYVAVVGSCTLVLIFSNQIPDMPWIFAH